jgi:hypothetical protein
MIAGAECGTNRSPSGGAPGAGLADLQREGQPHGPAPPAVASCFVEVMRNTPLAVHLRFWYALATITSPAVAQAWEPLPGLLLSVRGVALASLGGGPSGLPSLELPEPASFGEAAITGL